MKTYRIVQITYKNVTAGYITDSHGAVLKKAPILVRNWWMVTNAETRTETLIFTELPYKKTKYIGLL